MPKKIIIIEDDQDILDMMQYILKDVSYEVISLNAPKPLEEIIRQQPDLILLDERIPEIPGHEFCELIKLHPSTQNIPVILISAVPKLDEVANACKADGYIAKPFNLEDLTAVVHLYAPSSIG